MKLRFTQGQMSGRLSAVGGFPGDEFSLNLPECIGDAAQSTPASHFGPVRWAEVGGAWSTTARAPGELEYRILVVPHADTVDVEIHVTNESHRTWEQSMAFNCFAGDAAPSVRDFELVRHHVGVRNSVVPLRRLPRHAGPRSGVQAYGVAGGPPVESLPFAAAFKAAAPFVGEDWLAVQSRDGRRLVAAVSRPTLFLFQNTEFACIHSVPSFGRLAPGESGTARTRFYLVEDSLRGWYDRMRAELG